MRAAGWHAGAFFVSQSSYDQRMTDQAAPPPPQSPTAHLAPVDREILLRIHLAQGELFGEFAKARLKIVIDLVIMALRTLLLINGGAIVALLTVLSATNASISNPGRMMVAFGAFAGGIVLTLLAIAIAYMNQNRNWAFENATAMWLYSSIGQAHFGGDATPAPTQDVNVERGYRAVALALALGSVATFGLGSLSALTAIRPTTRPPPAQAAAPFRKSPPSRAVTRDVTQWPNPGSNLTPAVN